MADIFVSYASEDKADVARPLANMLIDRGYDVWFDEYSLKLGDSLLQEIDRGLAACRFGVVILSPDFFRKKWPRRELDGLVARETQGMPKRVLPVWHRLDADEVKKYSPILAGRFGVSTNSGLEVVVEAITHVLEQDASHSPTDVPQRSTNASSNAQRAGIADAHASRPSLLDRAHSLGKRVRDESAKDAFLNSEAGVKRAREEVSALFGHIENTVAKIRQIPEVPSIYVRTENDSIVVSSSVASFTVGWAQQYSNSLRHSSLYVCEYEGHHGRRVIGPPPELIEERSYEFGMSVSGSPCWVEVDADESCFSTAELSDDLIHWLMDRLEEDT
jgi:hypothetical protein